MKSKNDKKMRIGGAVREYRMRKLWTLAQMATVVGLNESTLSKIENGKTVPHDLTIARLERMLPGLFEDAA